MLIAALGAIAAAVVGVILNRAIWSGLHVLFAETHVVKVGGALGLTLVAAIAIAASRQE